MYVESQYTNFTLAVSGVNKLCHKYPECQAPKHEFFEVD